MNVLLVSCAQSFLNAYLNIKMENNYSGKKRRD